MTKFLGTVYKAKEIILCGMNFLGLLTKVIISEEMVNNFYMISSES